MLADTVVRARIPAEVKDKAIETLDRIGLSASDLIRLTFMRVASEGRLPFDVATPNATTRQAVNELASGKGKRHASAKAMLKDLGI